MNNEQETIVLGIVGIKNMGVYNASTTYEKLNVVTYQGSSYCALKETTGNLPTNTEYWQLYAEKGATGATGQQGPKPVKGVDYYTSDDIAAIEDDLSDFISDTVSGSVGSLVSATPLTASSTAGMTDTTRIYVNTTDGHWYWYNGTSWQDGGVYQATEDPEVTAMRIGYNNYEYDTANDSLNSQVNDLHNIDKAIVNGDSYEEKLYTNFTLGQVLTTGAINPSTNTCYGLYTNLKIRDLLYFDDSTYKASFIYKKNNAVASSTGWITSSPYLVSVNDFDELYINLRTLDETNIDTQNANNTTYYKTVINNNLLNKTEIYNDINEIINIDNALKKLLDNWGIRHINNGKYRKYQLPTELNNTYINVPIYTDDHNFITNFDVSDLKPSPQTTYYISPEGSSTNSGLSEDSPLDSIKSFHSKTGHNTCILLDGVYTLEHGMQDLTHIYRSCNLIAKNKGKVILTNGYSHSFTSVGNGVYSTSETNNINKVIDFSLLNQGITQELTLVDSLNECTNTQNSYYIDGETVYVHLYENKIPSDNNLVISITGTTSVLNFLSTATNLTSYIEGITIIGGYPCCLKASISSSYTNMKILAKDCKFLNSYTTQATYTDAVSLLGTQSIMQNCECAYAVKDGFNYHKAYNIIPYALEINCTSHDNGIYPGWEEKGNNGSTMHDGGKIIRLNGTYYNNNGGNAADIGDNTLAVNLGCIAYDSQANTQGASDSDFVSQGGNNIIYCDNCRGFGSYYSFASSDGTMYIHNCEYERINSKVIEN